LNRFLNLNIPTLKKIARFNEEDFIS